MLWRHNHDSSQQRKDGTEDIRIKVIEVILNDGTKKYLATNLFDSHISQQMLRELYFYRWPIETKYKELKELTTENVQRLYKHLVLFSGDILQRNA